MGWYTLVPNVEVFCKETYNDKEEVSRMIDDLKDSIAEIEERLIMYCYGDLEKIAKDNDTTYTGMKEVIKEDIEYLTDCQCKLNKLEVLRDNFDCRFGDFIKNPNLKENLSKWIDEELPLKEEENE